MANEKINLLTRREVEVFQMLGKGMSTRYVAKVLNVTYFTIRKHRSNILAKLELHTAGQLVYAAAMFSLRNAAGEIGKAEELGKFHRY